MIIRPPSKPDAETAAPGRRPAPGGETIEPPSRQGVRIILGMGFLVAAGFIGMSVYSLLGALSESPTPPPERMAQSPAASAAGQGSPVAQATLLPPFPPLPDFAPSASRSQPGPYGDTQFREALPDTLEAQYKTLVEESRAQPTNSGERRSLAISEESARKLKESGAIIQ